MFIIKLLTDKLKENKVHLDISRDQMEIYLDLLDRKIIGTAASHEINEEHKRLRRLVITQHRLEEQLNNYKVIYNE